jgi:hypothetical protein
VTRERLTVNKATFKDDAWFAGATFQGPAWFTTATFKDDAWFAEATFQSDARFDKAIFESGAWFDGAQVLHLDYPRLNKVRVGQSGTQSAQIRLTPPAARWSIQSRRRSLSRPSPRRTRPTASGFRPD